MGGRGDGSGGGGGGGGSNAPGKYSQWVDRDGNPLPEIDQETFEEYANLFSDGAGKFRRGIHGEGYYHGNYIHSIGIYEAQQFDNYLAQGEWTEGDLYRGVRMSGAALDALQPGAIVNQNGPASYSKALHVAENFAIEPAAGTNEGASVIFVLKGGTKAGRNIEPYSKFPGEKEVALASCSHFRVNEVHRNMATNITYVYGTEEIYQYNPQAVKGHGTQVVKAGKKPKTSKAKKSEEPEFTIDPEDLDFWGSFKEESW